MILLLLAFLTTTASVKLTVDYSAPTKTFHDIWDEQKDKAWISPVTTELLDSVFSVDANDGPSTVLGDAVSIHDLQLEVTQGDTCPCDCLPYNGDPDDSTNGKNREPCKCGTNTICEASANAPMYCERGEPYTVETQEKWAYHPGWRTVQTEFVPGHCVPAKACEPEEIISTLIYKACPVLICLIQRFLCSILRKAHVAMLALCTFFVDWGVLSCACDVIGAVVKPNWKFIRVLIKFLECMFEKLLKGARSLIKGGDDASALEIKMVNVGIPYKKTILNMINLEIKTREMVGNNFHLDQVRRGFVFSRTVEDAKVNKVDPENMVRMIEDIWRFRQIPTTQLISMEKELDDFLNAPSTDLETFYGSGYGSGSGSGSGYGYGYGSGSSYGSSYGSSSSTGAWYGSSSSSSESDWWASTSTEFRVPYFFGPSSFSYGSGYGSGSGSSDPSDTTSSSSDSDNNEIQYEDEDGNVVIVTLPPFEDMPDVGGTFGGGSATGSDWYTTFPPETPPPTYPPDGDCRICDEFKQYREDRPDDEEIVYCNHGERRPVDCKDVCPNTGACLDGPQTEEECCADGCIPCDDPNCCEECGDTCDECPEPADDSDNSDCEARTDVNPCPKAAEGQYGYVPDPPPPPPPPPAPSPPSYIPWASQYLGKGRRLLTDEEEELLEYNKVLENSNVKPKQLTIKEHIHESMGFEYKDGVFSKVAESDIALEGWKEKVETALRVLCCGFPCTGNYTPRVCAAVWECVVWGTPSDSKECRTLLQRAPCIKGLIDIYNTIKNCSWGGWCFLYTIIKVLAATLNWFVACVQCGCTAIAYFRERCFPCFAWIPKSIKWFICCKNMACHRGTGCANRSQKPGGLWQGFNVCKILNRLCIPQILALFNTIMDLIEKCTDVSCCGQSSALEMKHIKERITPERFSEETDRILEESRKAIAEHYRKNPIK